MKKIIFFGVLVIIFVIYLGVTSPTLEDTEKELLEIEEIISESEIALENGEKKRKVIPKETNSTETKEEVIVETPDKPLTEEDYKNNCVELWYDDIFFSEENLKGQKVKLHIYTEEHKFFNLDSIYNTQVSNFIKQYDVQRDILGVGVKREGADSYVGGQINLYFSNKYGYSATDYETGLELIIYGDIVDYSTNTWDGYNVCGIIPRYIE